MIHSRVLLLLLFFTIINACDRIPDKHWSGGIPHYTPAVIVSEKGASIDDVLATQYMSLLELTTPANKSVIQDLSQAISGSRYQIEAISIFPHDADDWKPVWIGKAQAGLIEAASRTFSRPYTESSYRFRKAEIHKLYMSGEVILFGVQLSDWLFVSESSYAIEETVRAYMGEIASLPANLEWNPGNLVINTPNLDQFVALETAVRYRPNLVGAFRGSGVAELRVTASSSRGSGNPRYLFEGTMPIKSASERSNLMSALSTRNHSNILDRYISLDAALAAFFSSPVSGQVPRPNGALSPVDAWFTDNPSDFSSMARTLGENFAIAAFSASGFMSVGEYAFLRRLEDRSGLVRQLENLTERELIRREGESYIIQSRFLSTMISGGLGEFDVFHLALVEDAVIITQRPTLIQKLTSDRSRRRTLYYNEVYLNTRRSFGDTLSGFVYAQKDELTRFIQTLLNTSHSTDVLLGRFDIAAMGFSLDNSGNVNWSTKVYEVERSVQPFEERWVVSLDGTDLTGEPVLANIGGSPRNEIMVSTEGGLVVALAADGTQVFRVRTGEDRPFGSPIVYDWYANNQMAILIGAGDKVYAWSNSGVPLPGFPISLGEQLSAPIQIADVTRNGLPEIIAATADRRVHVLNQRGQNISGWPQSVNASVRTQPKIETLDGRRSIFAYAENVVFSWDANGSVRTGFPVFNRAPLRGELVFHRNHILAGTADGNIIAIGKGDYFSNEHALIISPPSTGTEANRIQGVELSNGSIVLRKTVTSHSVSLPETGEVVTEPMLFAAASNGSLFGVSVAGALRFTQTLGQPSMENHPPIVADLNLNGRDEIVGIAGFGRLYGWELLSNERFLALPTTALKYPVVSDITGNGRMELVAGSREGLRCWTINR